MTCQSHDTYDELVEEVQSLCADAYALSTQRAAASARRCWQFFEDEYRHDRPAMLYGPSEYGLSLRASLHNEISLMIWCAWMVRMGLAASTVSTYLSLTRTSLEAELGWRITSKETSVRLPRMLRRLRKMYKTVRKKRLGWRAHHHRRWRRTLPKTMPEDRLLQHAAMCLAREGLCRAVELGPPRAEDYSAELHPSLGDVTYHATPQPHLVLMLLPAKKSPGKAHKMPVPLPEASGEEVGAYHAIVQLLARRTGHAWPFDSNGEVLGLGQTLSVEAPLLVDTRGATMLGPALVGFFASAALEIGLAGRVSGHSGRIGGATDHFARETPPAVLQICGRWDSDLWQIYTRQCIEQTLTYTVRASQCDDAALEEIFDDYTQPAR